MVLRVQEDSIEDMRIGLEMVLMRVVEAEEGVL